MTASTSAEASADRPLPDIFNAQLVGMSGAPEEIVVLMPRQRMTPDEALVHAAYLVCLADRGDRFAQILEAVQNT